MDIGGFDIEFPITVTREVLRFIFRLVDAIWTEAVYVTDVSGIRAINDLVRVSRDPPVEVFLFKNRGAAESWKKLGADSGNHDSMIYLIAEKDRLTFVVDDAECNTAKLVAEVTKALSNQPTFFGP